MSVVTSSPLKWVPAAAAGVTATSSSPDYGAWAEVLASAPLAGMQIAALTFTNYPAGGSANVQLGLGPAGAETPIGYFRLACLNPGGSGHHVHYLPLALDVPPGSRVAFRVSHTSGSTPFTVIAGYHEGGLSADLVTDSPSLVGFPATGYVTLTPSAVAWNPSAYEEVISAAALATICTVTDLAVAPASGVYVSSEIDLAIGAAGSEVIVQTLAVQNASGIVGIGNLRLPRPLVLPAATRVAVRLRKEGSSTSTWGAALNLFGDLSPALPPTEITFDPDADVSGETIGLTWVELRDAGGTLRVSSKTPLPDPSDYYGGWKEPDVIEWGPIRRALSDPRTGDYEGAEFKWTLSDTARVWRGILATDATKVLLNCACVIRMISDQARRALGLARTVVRGFVRRYKPGSPLTFEFTAGDWLARILTITIPRRTLSRTYFPDLPTDAIDKPEPILYGEMSDEGSASAPPQITFDPAEGGYIEGGMVNCAATGPTPASAAAPPTDLTFTVAAGGSLSLDVPNGEYGGYATSVDADGLESAPVPLFIDHDNGGVRSAFDAATPYDTVSAGNQTINAGWTVGAGAVKTRVYLGWYYFGFRPAQVIEVAAPGNSCAFTAGPAWSEVVTVDTVTPGAGLITWTNVAYYRISGNFADGESPLSNEACGIWRGYRRSVRIRRTAVAGLLSWNVYRRPPAGAFDRQWTVPAAADLFDDDWLDTSCSFITGAPAATGVVPVRHVGSENISGAIWQAFLVASHACANVISCFQNKLRLDAGAYGVTWLVPGQSGWPWGATLYRDINGRRYTMLYVRGPDGDDAASGARPITVNLQGIEDVGDATGTLLTSLLQQYKHFLKNFAFGDWQTGAWLDAPAFPADPAPEDADTIRVLDETSFDTADAVAAKRVTGGYLGATMIGAGDEILTLREINARWNRSCDVDCGFNRRTQYFVTMEDDDPELMDGAIAYTQQRDIIAESFDIEDLENEMFNVRPYVYGFRPATGAWSVEAQKSDATSIAALQETRRADVLELHMVRRQGVADDIAAHALARTLDPPRKVTWRSGLAALSSELGDILRVTHTDGIGPAGWDRQPVRLRVHAVDPNAFTVELECRDAGYLFRRRLDMTWLPPTAVLDGGGGSAAIVARIIAEQTAQNLYGSSSIVGPHQ